MIMIILLMILLQIGCSGASMYIINVASGISASLIDKKINSDEETKLEDKIEELEQKLDNKENEDDCENCETDKR